MGMPRNLAYRAWAQESALPVGSTFYCPGCGRALLWNRVKMVVGTPLSIESVEPVGREPFTGNTAAVCWHCGFSYGGAALNLLNWMPLYAEVAS